jgi:hypothetical protein
MEMVNRTAAPHASPARNTDGVNKQAVRVDVTDEFPFLVTKQSPYFDR